MVEDSSYYQEKKELVLNDNITIENIELWNYF
ncbi:unnamed protein product, partial [marine sediment metagenome]